MVLDARVHGLHVIQQGPAADVHDDQPKPFRPGQLDELSKNEHRSFGRRRDMGAHGRLEVHFLGNGLGFDYCTSLLQKLKPTHLFNQHMENPWIFDDEQLKMIKTNLSKREKLFSELFPWDSPNYGTDEHWIRCYPYQQKAERGSNVNIRIDVTNHSSKPRILICYPEIPQVWKINIASESVEIPAEKDGQVTFTFKIPEGIVPGLYVIPVTINYDNQQFAQFKEFLVEVL